jgi:exodeoxyribonuclease-1
MLGMRAKHKVSELVMAGKPFVYTSGKYSSEFEKTTVAMTVMKSKDKQSAVVFDLRYDPADYAKMSASELAEGMKWHKPGSESVVNVPLKTMKFNRCPAVAPLNVLDQATSMRLKIDMQQVEKHAKTLAGMSDFPNKIEKAIEMLDKLQQARLFADDRTVDEQLYDGFYGDNDRRVITKIREATPDELPDFEKSLNDERLKNLLPLYKARNFRNSMTTEERESWDGFKNNRLFAGEADSRLAKYLSKIEELKQQAGMTDKQKYLLTELELYGQSLLPSF